MKVLAYLDPIGRLLLAFGLPIFLIYLGASPAVMLFGILSWAVAVALKTTVYRLQAKVMPAKSDLLVATRIGIASAVMELGTTAAYMAYAWKSLSLLNVVAFGAAVGSFEVVFTVAMGIMILRRAAKNKNAAPANPAPAPGKIGPYAYFAGIIERLGAALLHIGSRGMVYAAFALGAPWLALAAVTFFGIVDGLAVLGSIRKWNWLDGKIFIRFYSAIWLIGLITLALFWASVR